VVRSSWGETAPAPCRVSAGIPTLFGMRTRLLITLLVFAGGGFAAQAQQYGWPPPNYSVTGVRADDSYHYRNLRQVLHDHGCGWRLHQLRARLAGTAPNADGLPPARLGAPLATPPMPGGQAEQLPPPHPAERRPDTAP
jgi:hypothetical protein